MLPFPKKCQSVALALMVVAGAAPTCALSQGMVNRPQLSAALANELVGETVAICAKQGYKVWAVVVNLDGVRQALLRGDGAPIHSQDNAYYKAYSAASITLGRNEGSTKEVADRMAKAAPSSVPFTQLPNVTYGSRRRDDQGGRAGNRRDRRERRSGRSVRRSVRPRSYRQDPGPDQVTRIRLVASNPAARKPRRALSS